MIGAGDGDRISRGYVRSVSYRKYEPLKFLLPLKWVLGYTYSTRGGSQIEAIKSATLRLLKALLREAVERDLIDVYSPEKKIVLERPNLPELWRKNRLVSSRHSMIGKRFEDI